MAFVRKNVWELGGDWPEPILWYARGVKAMKARPLNEPTAWRFFAAIHGIDQQLWGQLGYLSAADTLPSNADIQSYWSQCQHGSWYFLPWHRGYLIAFEAVVRDAVTKLGGPADWALPYWNYFKPNENPLPAAFASRDWPDGTGDNPLFVAERYGPNNDGNVSVDLDQVNLTALGDPVFTGAANGGDPGFGGVDTGFSHAGQVHGALETQPHDLVHGLVGGGDPQSNLPGLMSDPDTAGLDPIFWLHHGNIDRLWEVWRENSSGHADPSDPNWVQGPTAVGSRAFVLPMPGGNSWTYTPGEMGDLATLGYSYDDLSSPQATTQVALRMQRLGMSSAKAQSFARIAMPERKNVELLGANTGSLRVVDGEVKTSLALDPAVQRKVTQKLESIAGVAPTPPDRVFLNLENVRGLYDAVAFNVYVNLPDDENPAKHPDVLAGSLALFGVRKATVASGGQGGDGLTFVLDITHVIDALHLAGAFNLAKLQVRLAPLKPVPESAQISIGRVSVYRQGS